MLSSSSSSSTPQQALSQRPPNSLDWDHSYSDIRKTGTSTQNNNNNNDNTYPSADLSHCLGCGTSKCSKDDINRSRSISMQRSSHLATTTTTTMAAAAAAAAAVATPTSARTHCFDDQSIGKNQRSHRSRSKTVATTLCEPTKCDVNAISLRNSKRKTSQIRCSGPSTARHHQSVADRANAHFNHTFTDIDVLNGNVLECTNSTITTTTAAAATTTSTTITPRIICRNRVRASTKCAQSPSPCNRLSAAAAAAAAAAANTSMKRGKRTLSSTQIEREKSDEKNIKLKKHAVLSPILVASSARNSIKKIISASNAK